MVQALTQFLFLLSVVGLVPLRSSRLLTEICIYTAVVFMTYFRLGELQVLDLWNRISDSNWFRGTVALLPAVDTLIILRIYALYGRSKKSKSFAPVYQLHDLCATHSWHILNISLAWYVRLLCELNIGLIFSAETIVWDGCLSFG